MMYRSVVILQLIPNVVLKMLTNIVFHLMIQYPFLNLKLLCLCCFGRSTALCVQKMFFWVRSHALVYVSRFLILPTLLWNCWFDGRKSIRDDPASEKIECWGAGVVTCRLGVLETWVLVSRPLETHFYKSWSWSWSWSWNPRVSVSVLDLGPWRLGLRHSWSVKWENETK